MTKIPLWGLTETKGTVLIEGNTNPAATTQSTLAFPNSATKGKEVSVTNNEKKLPFERTTKREMKKNAKNAFNDCEKRKENKRKGVNINVSQGG
jgi:hypothetical protein